LYVDRLSRRAYFFFFAAAFFLGAAFFLVAIGNSPNRNLRSDKKSQRDSYIELLEKKVKHKMKGERVQTALCGDWDRGSVIRKSLRHALVNVRCVANIPSIAASAHIDASGLYHRLLDSRDPQGSGVAVKFFFA